MNNLQLLEEIIKLKEELRVIEANEEKNDNIHRYIRHEENRTHSNYNEIKRINRTLLTIIIFMGILLIYVTAK